MRNSAQSLVIATQMVTALSSVAQPCSSAGNLKYRSPSPVTAFTGSLSERRVSSEQSGRALLWTGRTFLSEPVTEMLDLIHAL